MDVAQIIPLADSWGMHDGIGAGWIIVMAVFMVVFMGTMMFGMARMGGDSEHGWSAPWERFTTRESPLEILERRFAEGEISAEDYRARREMLVDQTAKSNGDREDDTLTAPGAREGRQS